MGWFDNLKNKAANILLKANPDRLGDPQGDRVIGRQIARSINHQYKCLISF